MIGVDVALGLLALAMLVAAWRIARGPDDADRALAADMVLFSFAGLVALVGARAGIDATFDLVLVTTLVGVLGALSLARLLMRARR